MCNQNTIEVNPIDFMVVEAIRVFVPGFHEFMQNEKALFTDVDNIKGDPNPSKEK